MTVLTRPGGPIRLRDRAYDRRVFVFTDRCEGALTVSLRPASCATIEITAPGDDGRPVAMLINETCSFNVLLGRHVAAVVDVRS